MNAFVEALKNAFDFKCRASRSQYWMFVLVFVVVSFLLKHIDAATGTLHPTRGFGLLGTLWILFLLIPSLSLTTRRLHDIGRSGWWQLLGLIPILGQLALLFMLVRPSEPRRNAFGLGPASPAPTLS